MYLGQTVKKTPGVDYYGSGRYWVHHCKKHGTPVLLFSKWCETSQEFQQQLDKIEEEHPEYWKSENWANEVSETPWDNWRLNTKASDNTKKRLSDSHKGQKAWNKGLKEDPEVTKKRAAKLSVRTLPQSQRDNIAKGNSGKEGYWKGKKFSAEHSANISKSLTGIKHKDRRVL